MSKKDPFWLAKFSFLQDILSFLICLPPFALEHNFGKYLILRKAHYLTCIDNVQGDYLEFGVFTGSSFAHSVRAYSRLKNLDKRKKKMRFFGFDSFQGFGEIDEKTKHSFFQDSNFVWSSKRVVKRASKLTTKYGVRTEIVEGFFEETLDSPSSYNLEKAAIVFLDADLYEATRIALNFSLKLIQEGTIIIIDEYFYFKGKTEFSPFAAFKEWCEHNKISYRFITHYGIGSGMVIITKIPG